MEAMRYLGYVREIGEGVPRIRDEMLRLGLPSPEFSQSVVADASVLVTLRNKNLIRKMLVDTDVAKIVGESITSELTESEKIAVNYVAVKGQINVNEAQRQTGHNWHKSKKVLDGLVAKGIFVDHRRKDIKVDRQAYYALKAPQAPK